MCGCDCCNNGNLTCFDPRAMEASGTFYGWACECSCPGCIARVIEGAMTYAEVRMMRDRSVGSPPDPGYHSQRCLHCDHIRATHTLTATGCLGHSLPGRPGADCPCSEFVDNSAEPPIGTPVWFRGEWWAVDPMWDDTPTGGDRWYVSLKDPLYCRRRARWATMTGAVPAATPEEKP